MTQLKHLCFAILLSACAANSQAQNLLDKNISIQVNRQRLDNVLEIISNKGNFYFSYNSNIIKKDSLVSFNYTNKTVSFILNALLSQHYEFKESGNYIIIRLAPIKLTIVTKKAEEKDKFYSVAGYVYDEQSGIGINEASIYEKNILASAFTNDRGYFKIRLKNSKQNSTELYISKEYYEDTSVVIATKQNQELTVTLSPLQTLINNITVSPEDYLTTDTLIKVDSVRLILPKPPVADTPNVEKLGLSKFFLSAKQTIQSANLKNFFTTRPFQISLVPKFGTHGYMSAQVVNNFSLNIFGGYTAGTNGVEIGGLVNIDKLDVRYVQIAGLVNQVGGSVKGFQAAGITNTVLKSVQGFQMAGINNTVLDSISGFQAAGIANFVKGNFKGFQVGGIYNHVTDSVQGFQISGIANYGNNQVKGLQIAGIANINKKETRGVQIAGIVNYSKKIRGVQVALINIADTSEGFSIGLINIIRHGYHKLSISTNEVTNVNVAFKTGNPKLYSILTGSVNAGTNNRIYSFGFGVGSELPLNKRKTISFNPELSWQYLYLGSWSYTNNLSKASLNFNVQLAKNVSLFAGPSFNVYDSDQYAGIAGYRFPIPTKDYNTFKMGDRVKGWFGWNIGINLF